MGSLGMPEIIVIFVLLIVLLVIPAIIAIALIWYFSSRRNKPPQIPQGQKSVPERLSELDDLRSRNLITEAEHAEKRARILGDL